MAAGDVDLALLAGAGVLLVAIAGVRASTRLGVPSLLLYLAIGVVLGQDVLGLQFDDARLARDLGLVALALILAEGGLTTQWPRLRRALPVASLLATLGVAVSIAVTSVAAHMVLRVDWRTSALAGAVLSSTDAAAVFATLRALRLPERLVSVIEAESGLNDAPVVIVVTLLSTHGGPGHGALALGYQLANGAAFGLTVGALGTVALRRAALPAVGLYPIATIAFAVGSYAAAAAVHASGFLAVYLTSVWLGNARLPHRRATLGFAEGIGWLAQIGLFVMLGLLATPSDLASSILPALAVGLVLLVLARPLAVLASLSPLRVGWREQAFLSWAGLRGAVPVVLSTVPGDPAIFNLVFVLVIAFTLLQTPMLPWVARRLGVADREKTLTLDIESSPLTRLDADLLQLSVPSGSLLTGVELFELRLPTGAAVMLVVRDDSAFVPTPTTMLRVGDELIVVTLESLRSEVEQRFHAVSRAGRLAGWHEHTRRARPAGSRSRRPRS
jgi:potassium/hydrogen antiporter